MSRHRNSSSSFTRTISIVGVAALALLLDQISKRAIASSFLPGESRIVLPNLLKWTYERNFHGAFGYFGSNSALLIAMALVVLVVFWLSFRESAQHSRVVCVAFGLILGGAIGNIVDRIHLGYVVDFVDVYRFWPNIFNVADSCITIGVALLLLKSFATHRRA